MRQHGGNSRGIGGILWADTLSTAANIARNAVAMQDDEQWDFIEEIVKRKVHYCSGGANAFRHNLYHRTNRSTA